VNISKAWGYAAIAMPGNFVWQPFEVLDPDGPDIADLVDRAISVAKETFAGLASITGPVLRPEAGLAALAAECLTEGNQLGLSVYSAAISKMTGKRFWVIDVLEVGGDETVTNFVPLDVATPELARDLISQRMRPLEMGRMLKQKLS
jgi:hypothetical protein